MHALRDFGQRSCHTATCRTFATSAAHDDVESYSVHSNANNKAMAMYSLPSVLIGFSLAALLGCSGGDKTPEQKQPEAQQDPVVEALHKSGQIYTMHIDEKHRGLEHGVISIVVTPHKDPKRPQPTGCPQ